MEIDLSSPLIIGLNLLMVGVAYQRGLLPIKAETLEATIKANRSPELGLLAFRWGRMAVVDPDYVATRIRELEAKPVVVPKITAEAQALIDSVSGAGEGLRTLLATRVPELIAFQNAAYAERYVALVRRVLATYEKARLWAVAHPAELKSMMMAATKLSDPVIARQLERTDLSSGKIGEPQAITIIEAGKALQAAGVLDGSVDVAAVTGTMVDPSFARAAGA